MIFETSIYIPALNFAGQRNNQEIVNILLLEHGIEINNKCFIFCNKMTRITIPSSVTSIGNSAFYGCSSLSNISIPSSVTSIGDFAFYGCSSLSNISIPSSVTSIGNSAFSGCSSLSNISIPSSLNINNLGIGPNVDVELI